MIAVYFKEYQDPATYPDYLINDLAAEKRVVMIKDKETGRTLYKAGEKDLERYPFQFREVD